MSVLEKFLILFESDADKASKDVKKLDKSLDDTEKTAKAATDAANSFSEGAKHISSSSRQAAASLSKMSKEEIVKSKQIDSLRQLSKDLSKMSETKALDIGKKIGLSEKQIKTLRKGKEGVRELSSELKGVDSASKSSGEQFLSMGKKALGAVGATMALTAAIAGLVVASKRLDELKKFSDLIGENIDDVDAWSGAVVRAGGTSDGFKGTVEALNEKMVDASIRGSNEITPFFNQLGISIVDVNGKVKKTLDILPELADSFSRISKERSLGIGKKLGLDISTIALLQKGRGEIEKLIERQKMLGLATDKAGNISAEFVDIMSDFKQVSGFAAQGLIVSFLPAMTWTIDKLIDLSIWARENKPIVIGFFAGVGAVATPMLYSLAAAGWAAISPFVAMAAPFIAIAAAVGLVGSAIALVVEDIMSFIGGEDSLLGNLIDKVSSVKSFFGFGDEKKTIDLNKNISIGKGSIALASNNPIAAQTSNSISNITNAPSRSTSVQTGDINIQTQATDSRGIASEIGGSVKEQMRTTIENYDDGIQI